MKTPRLIAPRLRKTRPRGWERWAFSPSGLEAGAVLTLVSRSVIGAGFALPRDAGLKTGAPCVGDVAPPSLPAAPCGDWRWEFRLTAVWAAFRHPRLGPGNGLIERREFRGLRPRCRSEDRRSYPAFLPCGERCWCDDRRSWRDGIFVATALPDFWATRERHETVNTSGWKTGCLPGARVPVRPDFSSPCRARPALQRGFSTKCGQCG